MGAFFFVPLRPNLSYTHMYDMYIRMYDRREGITTQYKNIMKKADILIPISCYFFP